MQSSPCLNLETEHGTPHSNWHTKHTCTGSSNFQHAVTLLSERELSFKLAGHANLLNEGEMTFATYWAFDVNTEGALVFNSTARLVNFPANFSRWEVSSIKLPSVWGSHILRKQQIASCAFAKLFYNCLAAIGGNFCCILGDNGPFAVLSVQAVSHWMIGHQDNIDCLHRIVTSSNWWSGTRIFILTWCLLSFSIWFAVIHWNYAEYGIDDWSTVWNRDWRYIWTVT